MITLSVKPKENSTAIITLTFTDKDGIEVMPVSAAWQLQNHDGIVINGRSFENCPFLGNEVVLSGNDLAIFGATDSGYRIFAVEVVYHSKAGNYLPLTDEIRFRIQRLISQVDLDL